MPVNKRMNLNSECYSAVQKQTTDSCMQQTTWVNFKTIMMSERSQARKTTYPMEENLTLSQYVWCQAYGFSIPRNSPVLCGHQLGVLQLNSVPVQTTESWQRNAHVGSGVVGRTLYQPRNSPSLLHPQFPHSLKKGVMPSDLPALWSYGSVTSVQPMPAYPCSWFSLGNFEFHVFQDTVSNLYKIIRL